MTDMKQTKRPAFANIFHQNSAYLRMYLFCVLLPFIYMLLSFAVSIGHVHESVGAIYASFISYCIEIEHNRLVILMYMLSIYYFAAKHFIDRCFPPRNRYNRDVSEVSAPIILFNLPAALYIWIAGLESLKSPFINILSAEVVLMFALVAFRWLVIGIKNLSFFTIKKFVDF